jgi:hypothetical protein
MALSVCVVDNQLIWARPEAAVVTTPGVTGNLWPGTPFISEQTSFTVNVLAPATFLLDGMRSEPSVQVRYTVGLGFEAMEADEPFH